NWLPFDKGVSSRVVYVDRALVAIRVARVAVCGVVDRVDERDVGPAVTVEVAGEERAPLLPLGVPGPRVRGRPFGRARRRAGQLDSEANLACRRLVAVGEV